jgi:5,10-methylenetetrahydromethanopterin reductase
MVSSGMATSSQRLKFCLDLSHHAWTRPTVLESTCSMQQAAEQTIRMIEAADAAGLESAWLSEDPDGWDAFAVLTAAARSTTQIQLGTGVTNPYLRHPNLMSMSISTLDRMSGGRAFLGLGRGQPEWYQDQLGGSGSRSPLGQLEDTIRLLRQWEQPPHRASTSRDVPVRDWARAIWPAQNRVPIYIAALGPKALDLSARLADGVLIADFATVPYLEELIPDMRKRVAGYGRDPDAFRFYLRTGITLTSDPEPAIRYRKAVMSLLSPLPGMAQHIVHPDYDVPAIIESVGKSMRTRETLAQGGNFIDIRQQADFEAARAAIPDEFMADISYIGTPDEVNPKLDRLQEIGITHVFLSPPAEPEPAAFSDIVSKLSS